jgi:hypothetical protein
MDTLMKQNILPEKLFQYQPCTSKTMANLANGVIHFGSPSQFNDPFDCSFTFPAPTAEQLPLLRDFFLKENAETIPERDEDFAEFINDKHDSIFALIKEEQIDPLGICCFSKNRPELADSFLMWAHYASSHTGFCLEFETSNKPFSLAKEVKYDALLFELDIHQSLIDGGVDDNCVRTKSKHWGYEDEWRIIVMPKSDKHKYAGYEPCQLTAVYFGARMNAAEQNAIANIVRQNNPDIALIKMKCHARTFQLEMEKLA